jgi:enoyl-CoA hydratase/carnithine racemase
MAPSGPVIVDDCTPRVRAITLNRPQRRNAFSGEAKSARVEAVESCEARGRHISRTRT